VAAALGLKNLLRGLIGDLAEKLAERNPPADRLTAKSGHAFIGDIVKVHCGQAVLRLHGETNGAIYYIQQE
jgi:hypothetical protein